MPTLTAEAIVDLVTTTQKELGRQKWTDISVDLQEHVAANQLLRKNRVVFDDSTGPQFNVVVDISRQAAMVGLYHAQGASSYDVMKTANLPWRHCRVPYVFDRLELAMNRGAARIVELIKVRRYEAMVSLAEKLEEQFWNKPADSTDELNLFGVPYWIVKNATEGFNGGNPSGFTSGCGGLSSTTYSRWRNWSANYAEISESDLTTKWRKAAEFTKFKTPIGAEHPNYNTGDRYGYYTTYRVLAVLEKILRFQNDNLGNDLASKDGRTLFRGNQVTWVPYLEANDTSDPIYGINWGTTKMAVLKGEYLREEKPMNSADQPSTFVVWNDLTCQLECRDRRRNFVLYK